MFYKKSRLSVKLNGGAENAVIQKSMDVIISLILKKNERINKKKINSRQIRLYILLVSKTGIK